MATRKGRNNKRRHPRMPRANVQLNLPAQIVVLSFVGMVLVFWAAGLLTVTLHMPTLQMPKLQMPTLPKVDFALKDWTRTVNKTWTRLTEGNLLSVAAVTGL